MTRLLDRLHLRWYDALLLALTFPVTGFAAVWISGSTGFWWWSSGLCTAYIVYGGYGLLRDHA